MKANEVYAILKAKINELDGLSSEQIKAFVDDYLQENPISSNTAAIKSDIDSIKGTLPTLELKIDEAIGTTNTLSNNKYGYVELNENKLYFYSDASKTTLPKIITLPERVYNGYVDENDPIYSKINELEEKIDNTESDDYATTQYVDSEITEVKNNIDDLDTRVSSDILAFSIKPHKRFILIGDSLSKGTGSAADKGWAYWFKQELKLSDDDCYRFLAVGYGFTKIAGSSTLENGFLKLLTDGKSSVKNPDTITDIICIGGLNDANPNNPCSLSQMTANVNSFVSYCNVNFINAKVHIGMLGTIKYKADDISNTAGVKDNIINKCLPAMKQAKAHYISGIEYYVETILGLLIIFI